MSMLRCSDYGYPCEFKTKGKPVEVINEFKSHMDDEHGIDYSKKAVLHFVLRKENSKINI